MVLTTFQNLASICFSSFLYSHGLCILIYVYFLPCSLVSGIWCILTSPSLCFTWPHFPGMPSPPRLAKAHSTRKARYKRRSVSSVTHCQHCEMLSAESSGINRHLLVFSFLQWATSFRLIFACHSSNNRHQWNSVHNSVGSVMPFSLPSPATSSFSLTSDTKLMLLPSPPCVPSPCLFLRSALAPCSLSRLMPSCFSCTRVLAFSKSGPQGCAVLPAPPHVMSGTPSPGMTQPLLWKNGLCLSSRPQAPLFPGFRASPPHVSLSVSPARGKSGLSAFRPLSSLTHLPPVRMRNPSPGLCILWKFSQITPSLDTLIILD